ncbi:MAG: heme lyase CcmF/NrfE family subunit [Alphaproteobacteria bacterium]
MISELGIVFLFLALVLTSLSFIKLNLSFFNINFSSLCNLKITNIVFILIFSSFIILTYSFTNSDFSLDVVVKNSNSQLPFIYKVTGVWGNHEGSILLWLLVMAFFGFIFSKIRNINNEFKELVLTIQNSLIFLVSLFIVFTSNPFQKSFPPKIEGVDLNPLLQDPGLAIHPPFLYLGYVGFSIVYSISLALISNKSNFKFIGILKPWVFISWTFLTIGIGLGSWWAYYELGWGGFWFWDPVENASLLPWLTASTLLHTILLADKNSLFFKWTIFLAIFTFILSLLGTFLVRSGVLVSVHAFANDPSRGLFILFLLLIITLFGFTKFLKILDNKNHKEINFLSREGVISLNSIFMLSLTFTILIGTIYPIFSSVILDKKISVGAPFFNSILSPMMIPLTFGMIVGPFIKWGRDDLKFLINRIKNVIFLILISSLIIWYFNFGGPILSIIFFILGGSLIASSTYELTLFLFSIKRKVKLSKKILSQILAHLGIGILIIGVTGSSILKEEKIQFQSVGEDIMIKEFNIKFLGVKSVEGENYISQMGFFDVSKNGKVINRMTPEKRFYNSGKQMTTEAAISSGIFGDLYIALGDKSENDPDEKKWTTRIWYNPFTLWIWMSVILLALAGLISFVRFSQSRL